MTETVQNPRTPEETSDDAKTAEKVRLAVFDIDGTCIKGQSPAIVTWNLFTKGVLSLWRGIKAIKWGIRYKLGFTLETQTVREMVFDTLKKYPVDEANAILKDIYEERVSHRLRPKAMETIRWHQSRGDVVVFISATFEYVAGLFAEETGVYRQSSTIMEIKDGHYTGNVCGQPCEGDEKPIRLKTYADAEFGEGNWVLAYSYGDHMTDIPIMEIAENAIAVTPKKGLEKVARERGWQIAQW